MSVFVFYFAKVEEFCLRKQRKRKVSSNTRNCSAKKTRSVKRKNRFHSQQNTPKAKSSFCISGVCLPWCNPLFHFFNTHNIHCTCFILLVLRRRFLAQKTPARFKIRLCLETNTRLHKGNSSARSVSVVTYFSAYFRSLSIDSLGYLPRNRTL